MAGSGTGRIRLIDIGSNLVDEMFEGIYNGASKHEPDLDKVLQRAWNVGVEKIFVTAGNLEESRNAAKLVRARSKNNGEECKLYSTLGVHPTRCSEFLSKAASPNEYLNDLKKVLDEERDRIVALGEFGLDYERTNFCDIETQKRFFKLQLTELGPMSNLPLFLHCRAAANDIHQILQENRACFPKGGVVHSFDGTLEELKSFLDLGLYIGINGCSLKTEENCKVVKEIPVESLLLETDSPWCGIRPSHHSSQFVKTKFEISKKNWSPTLMFKQRNEPQTMLNVLEVVSGLMGMNPNQLAQNVFENTNRLFFNSDAVV